MLDTPSPFARTRKPLRGMMLALGLSLVLHAMAFWHWRVVESRGVTALPTLQVRIQVAQIAEAAPEETPPVVEPPAPRSRPRPETRPAPQPTPEKAVEAAPEPVAIAEFETEPEAPSTVAAATVEAAVALAPDPVETANLEARYKAELAAAIARHRRYPPLSRRLREQGTVTVAFAVHRDGLIANIRLERGSGYPRLDEAALAAVRAVGRFRPIPALIAREVWAFVIPVEYRLA